MKLTRDESLPKFAFSMKLRHSREDDHKPAYFTQSTALLAVGQPQEAVDCLAALLRMDPAAGAYTRPLFGST